MKIKLTPTTAYAVEIDGVKIPGSFTADSEWNGMKCVKGTGGKIIYAPETPFAFDTIFGKSDIDGDLISATPDIISAVHRGQL